ncbi:MAG: PAS domain S-box protein [Methylococcales bacterium]
MNKKLGKHQDYNIVFSEKWDLAISRLTSDYAYSMLVTEGGTPIIEWVTEPFKRFLNSNTNTNLDSKGQAFIFGLLIHPDDIAIVQERTEKLLAGYENATEYRVMTNTGDTVCFYDHALPIRDWSEGCVVRIYGAIQDVTNRRKTEEKLHLMQAAIDCSNNSIIITGLEDTNWGIIYANNAFVKMSGYSLSELMGQNCRFLQGEDRDQPDLEKLRTALQNQGDGHGILRNYRKDGSMFWNEIYISPVLDKQGRVSNYVGVQMDVSNRINLENLLVNSETKLRSIFDNVVDGILIFDSTGVIESVNPAAEIIFGYAKEELIGTNIDRLLKGHDPFKHSKLASTNFMCEFNAKSQVVKGLRKDRSIFPIDLGISKIDFDDRQCFVGMVHDISQRMQAEDMLRELSPHLLSVREEESTRIAREIHDVLGSNLAALKMGLNWLNKQLQNSPPGIKEKVLMMNHHIDESVQAVRQITTDLRPSILDHLGLISTIEWQLERFRLQTGMQCTDSLPDHDIEMDEKRVTAIFGLFRKP